MSQQTVVYFDADGNEIDVADIVAEHSGGLVKDLRGQLKESQKEAKRAADLEADLATYKRGDAMKEAGLDKLTDKQRKAIEATHDGEWTPEALRATALDLGVVTKSAEEMQLEADLDADGRLVEAASGAGPNNTGVIKPEDTANWDMDKLMRFRTQFPDKFEALKRNETVVGQFT